MRLPAPRHRRSSVLCPASDSGATCTTWRASGSSRPSTAYQRRNPSCRDRAQGSGELQICPAFFEQGSGDPGHLRECRYFPRLSSRISFRDCGRTGEFGQPHDLRSVSQQIPFLVLTSHMTSRYNLGGLEQGGLVWVHGKCKMRRPGLANSWMPPSRKDPRWLPAGELKPLSSCRLGNGTVCKRQPVRVSKTCYWLLKLALKV